MPAPAYTLRTVVSLDSATTGDYSLLSGGGLLIDGAGSLVGATSEGGQNGSGAVFEVAPGAAAPTVVAPFSDASGYNILTPSSLAADAAGNLYGEQYFGGANGHGTVFEIANTGTKSAPVYASAPTVLASFDPATTGYYGTSGLLVDDAGNLVGMTWVGGASDIGTVFELKNAGSALAPSYTGQIVTLASFDGLNGREPFFNGRLISDAAGNLVGTVQAGGADNDGTVFEIANTGTKSAPAYAATATVLASFTGKSGVGGPSGSRPYGSVVADANGNLFGTTFAEGADGGDGTIYEIANTGTKDAPAYAAGATTLVSLEGFDALSPYGALLIDKAGDLYGTASFGGSGGAVYELANTGTATAPRYAAAPTVLASLGGAYGSYPTSDLAVDGAGDLFATTVTDGANDRGTVFELVAAPAPTITGTTASNVTAAERPIAPFATAAVNDPTPGATETLTIVLTGGGGTLRDGPDFGGTSTLASTAPGTYTLTGAAADVTAELRALSFTPTAGAPGATSTTAFALSDATSANGFVTATDTRTTVVDTAAPPPPDAISFFPQVFYTDGAFTLAGTVASAAGVSSVEITAQVDGVATDLGAATVAADGTFSFKDVIGASTQGFITATETDVAGAMASAQADYSLMGGLPGGKARQNRYTADGSAETATDVFKADGSQKARLFAPSQSFTSSSLDTFNNGGQPSSTFVFDPGFGRDVVSLFRVDGADHDVLSFQGSDYGNAIATVLSHARNTAAGLLITDPTASDSGMHDKLLLEGITKQQLRQNQGDIAFHA